MSIFSVARAYSAAGINQVELRPPNASNGAAPVLRGSPSRPFDVSLSGQLAQPLSGPGVRLAIASLQPAKPAAPDTLPEPPLTRMSQRRERPSPRSINRRIT